MTKHELAAEYVLRHIGATEVPKGSNHGPFPDHVQTFDFVNGTGYAWCVCTWLAAWAEGAMSPLPYKTPGAFAMLNWAKKEGWAVDHPSKLIQGDAVVFKGYKGAGHLATFLSWEPQTRTIFTVDGNVDDSVKRCRRGMDQWVGGIHVPEQPVVVKTPKTPMFVVASAENGERKVLYVSGAKAVQKKLPQILNKHASVTITRRKKNA